jgi:hypothetical protein
MATKQKKEMERAPSDWLQLGGDIESIDFQWPRLSPLADAASRFPH